MSARGSSSAQTHLTDHATIQYIIHAWMLQYLIFSTLTFLSNCSWGSHYLGWYCQIISLNVGLLWAIKQEVANTTQDGNVPCLLIKDQVAEVRSRPQITNNYSSFDPAAGILFLLRLHGFFVWKCVLVSTDHWSHECLYHCSQFVVY